MAAHIYTTLNILVLHTSDPQSLTPEITGECFQSSRRLRVNYSSRFQVTELRIRVLSYNAKRRLVGEKRNFRGFWKTWRHQGPTQILCNLLCHCVLAKQTTADKVDESVDEKVCGEQRSTTVRGRGRTPNTGQSSPASATDHECDGQEFLTKAEFCLWPQLCSIADLEEGKSQFKLL